MTHAEAEPRSVNPTLYLKLSAMTVIWGGTFISGRIVTQSLGPFSAAFCRYAIATVMLVALTRWIEGRLPRLQLSQWPAIVLLGITGVFAYNALFFLGLERVPASRAALIVTTNPTVIALGAAIAFRHALTPLRLVGIGLGLLGAATVITNGMPWLIFQGVSRGDLYLVGCVLSWATYSLVGKAVMANLSPFAAITYACLVGTPMLLGPALQEGLVADAIAATPTVWLHELYLAVLGTVVAFYWYYQGLQQLGPAKASIFINFVPVVAVLLAAVTLGEPLSLSLLVGGALVISGVFLTNRY
ncbi:MAG: DMT family transporter [Cyanobacteria bacterium P01_A01_bin.135]